MCERCVRGGHLSEVKVDISEMKVEEDIDDEDHIHEAVEHEEPVQLGVEQRHLVGRHEDCDDDGEEHDCGPLPHLQVCQEACQEV